MKCLQLILRKLFLIKEIVSQEGKLHFQRWRLLSTPWFRIYIHQILLSDLDAHKHDHPWHFLSFILRGSYREVWSNHPDHAYEFSSAYSSLPPEADRQARRIIRHHAQDAHQITLLTPSVWTLVLAYGRRREWGYLTSAGWIDHQTYRSLKRANKLPL